jgi:alkyl sulfatase BDS1-like metallo-beta-lactamase superfamily hydrolase
LLQTDKVIAFTFGDRRIGLHVRRGVAEYIDDVAKYLRPSDIDVAMDGATWAKLYLNQVDLKEAVARSEVKITKGDAQSVVELFAMFDKFDPAANVTVPAAHHQ